MVRTIVLPLGCRMTEQRKGKTLMVKLKKKGRLKL